MNESTKSPIGISVFMGDSHETANSLTHGFGLVLSLVGVAALLTYAKTDGDVWYLTSCAIYSLTLVAVYAASTASHLILRPESLNRRLRIADQGLIYLLIAGTYTPFGLMYLRDGGWWLLLGAMWGGAMFGFISKVFFTHRIEGVLIALYLLLGWLPIVSVYAVAQRIAENALPALALMLAGGICYTLGTIFLITDHKKFHFHAIWHLWVIAGSGCHFFVIYLYIYPQSG